MKATRSAPLGASIMATPGIRDSSSDRTVSGRAEPDRGLRMARTALKYAS